MRLCRRARAGLLLVLAAAPATGTAAPGPPAPATEAPPPGGPTAYLIYLLDGRDPIVVQRYVEEGDEIRFEKYGGWVGIPRYEVLRIVPDDPATRPPLPPPAPPPAPDLGGPGTVDGALPAEGAGEGDLFVTVRGGGQVKARSVTAEGDRIRVTVPDGSFTLPRADLVGVVRVPPGDGPPEAWLAVTAAAAGAPGPDGPAHPGPPASPSGPGPGATEGTPGPVLPYTRSDRPHLLRLASGQVMRVDAFWVEGGEIRFRRYGGMIGIALAEVRRLVAEDLVPAQPRTPVRFVQQLGPDLLEVLVRSGRQRIRLIGLEPVARPPAEESPWDRLRPGLILELEFDRQRFAAPGEWLAYAFLPGGRMLNAELIRLGWARPRPDGKNFRYVDLFQELASLAGSAGPPAGLQAPVPGGG